MKFVESIVAAIEMRLLDGKLNIAQSPRLLNSISHKIRYSMFTTGIKRITTHRFMYRLLLSLSYNICSLSLYV